jgi:hypothetical protein
MNIPAPTRDASLLIRLIPIVVIGEDKQKLDREGQSYLRLLCRLTDKAFTEYMTAKEYIDREIQKGDVVAYGFTIIDHLENCLNALNRIAKAFEKAETSSIFTRLSEDSKRKIRTSSISPVRNMMEHIEKEIQRGDVHGSLFLSLDTNYEKISINNKSVKLKDLVEIIETYHKGMLEIVNNL